MTCLVGDLGPPPHCKRHPFLAVRIGFQNLRRSGPQGGSCAHGVSSRRPHTDDGDSSPVCPHTLPQSQPLPEYWMAGAHRPGPLRLRLPSARVASLQSVSLPGQRERASKSLALLVCGDLYFQVRPSMRAPIGRTRVSHGSHCPARPGGPSLSTAVCPAALGLGHPPASPGSGSCDFLPCGLAQLPFHPPTPPQSLPLPWSKLRPKENE